jgi:hypothetical protein
MRFTSKDQREAVHGIKFVIHDHFKIIENSSRELMSLIANQEERFSFFLEQMKQPVLYSPEHSRFSCGRVDPECSTELSIELHKTDR